MTRKYKPKHPERFTTPERARKMLEQTARLLGKGPYDHLISIDLTIRRWYADEGAPVSDTTHAPHGG